MGKIKDSKWFVSQVCWVLLVLLPIGCSPFDREYGLSDLESPDTSTKIMAIKWAGDNKVTEAVPELVDLLQDEDGSVRFYSIEALRRITGTDNGYDYKSAPTRRVAAVRRWREYIDSNKVQK